MAVYESVVYHSFDCFYSKNTELSRQEHQQILCDDENVHKQVGGRREGGQRKADTVEIGRIDRSIGMVETP